MKKIALIAFVATLGLMVSCNSSAEQNGTVVPTNDSTVTADSIACIANTLKLDSLKQDSITKFKVKASTKKSQNRK